jgi:ornithine cyclodeaminase/alanine dehydrogenase-like protein (mu-crystallin family)
MLVLSRADVLALMRPMDVIAAVKQAMLSLEDGSAPTPERLHTNWNGNTLLTMPAVSADPDDSRRNVVGVKMVSVVPSNAARHLPVTIGVMLLSSAETGETLALIDAASLTGIRTGAVGAVGVELMTPDNTDSIGVVGCGAQGTWQAIFACAVRPIRRILCFDPNMANVATFITHLMARAPQAEVISCEDSSSLLQETDIVIAASTSTAPVLPNDPDLLRGKHFISVGSFRPHMQEMPDAVYDLARAIAVDSSLARHEVGDVINAVRRGMVLEEDVYPIGRALAGKRAIDRSATTVYKTAGMAMFDLFVARMLYDAALENGMGQQVNL